VVEITQEQLQHILQVLAQTLQQILSQHGIDYHIDIEHNCGYSIGPYPGDPQEPEEAFCTVSLPDDYPPEFPDIPHAIHSEEIGTIYVYQGSWYIEVVHFF